MMKSKLLVSAFAASLVFSANVSAGKPVAIVKGTMDVTVKHNGADVKISRNQDNKNTINPAFAKTSRPCPPLHKKPGG